MSASCIYTGTVRHRRYAERRRDFQHRIALLYLDLDELPTLLGGRLVARSPGVVRVRRRDYLRPLDRSLSDAVRDEVQRTTGRRPAGPVGILTHPRIMGHCFNPVSFYYCWESGGGRIEAALAEVTNTPWGERHTYALSPNSPSSRVANGEFRKALHVSPFMGMDQHYRARATAPGETASVHIESWSEGELHFDATLSLRRRALTRQSLAAIVAGYPFGTLRVLSLIYGHAIGLKLGGVGVHPHPVS